MTSDKLQLCSVVGAMSGDFLPPPPAYLPGKTTACLPRHQFPEDWHVTYTPIHWSNEDKMIEYIEKIILPYVEGKCKDHKLSVVQPALAISDIFREHPQNPRREQSISST